MQQEDTILPTRGKAYVTRGQNTANKRKSICNKRTKYYQEEKHRQDEDRILPKEKASHRLHEDEILLGDKKTKH